MLLLIRTPATSSHGTRPSYSLIDTTARRARTYQMLVRDDDKKNRRRNRRKAEIKAREKRKKQTERECRKRGPLEKP